MYAARAGRFLTVAVVCAVTLLVGGCSGDDKAQNPKADPSGTASGGELVPVQSKVGKVAGALKPAAAAAAVKAISPVVDGWFEAGYVGGDYPRTTFGAAFPGFTRGAAADATKDAALMTNKAIGADVDGVTANLKQIEVDLLAANRRAAGATARFTLVFTTTGTYAKEVSVKGRLFLTKGSAGKWQVFGYNVTRSAR